MRRSTKLITVVAFILASVATGALAIKLADTWLGVGQPDQPLKQEFYEVKTHENPMRIARDLQALGVVSNSRDFYWYARLTGKSRRFKAGDYRFTNHMKADEVLAILVSGVSYGVPLVIPEGFNMYQIADAFERLRPGAKARFLELCADRGFIDSLGLEGSPATLEGYLYPETYLVGRKTPEKEIIRNMVRKFKSIYTPELQSRARELGLSERAVVTLASMVEKETGSPAERPMISSVFHNRLKKHMRLQSDPTVIYGKFKSYNGNITRKDLETPTPYNTYTIPALPAGPIANPGKEAIHAALYPATSDFLYFVSHNDGTHEFTTTYEAHRNAVAKFQLDPKARDGKSWRDLKKRGLPAAIGKAQ